MKFRLNAVIIALTVLLLTISGPSAFAASSVQKDLVQSSTIEKVLRSGKLRVGMATFVPWAMQSKTGEWIGFEIDVAKRLAQDMGVKVEFIPTKWEGLIPSLLTGKFDLVIAGMMGTPQRALKINFTQPYDFTGTQICIHKDYVNKIKTPMDLNDEAYIVLSRVGVTAAETAKKYLERIKIVDKIPHLVKLYERFGAIEPDKIDTNNRRIEWNIESLNKQEERIFTYIIYSKIGVVGRFELPEAKAVYEKEGKVKHATSNRSFYYILDPGVFDEDAAYWEFNGNYLIDMDANDTYFIRYIQSGGNTSTDMATSSYSFGTLAC